MKEISKLIINTCDTVDFKAWLLCEAEIDFSQIYINEFKTYYSSQISQEVETRLEFLAKGLTYMLKTYTSITPDYNITNILDYSTTYIETQLGNFDIDFDGLIVWSEDGESDPI